MLFIVLAVLYLWCALDERHEALDKTSRKSIRYNLLASVYFLLGLNYLISYISG